MMPTSQQSRFANEEYTVGWICALPEELAAAQGMMDEIHGSPQTAPAGADHNTYKLGTIGRFKVVVASLRMNRPGASSATASAKDMLFTFPNLRVGLLVGIGAGIPDTSNEERDVRLGDVVVGCDSSNGGVVVYDFGKKLGDGTFQSISILNQSPPSLLSALASIKAKHFLQESKMLSYLEDMLVKFPRLRRAGFAYPGKSHDRFFQPSYIHPKEAASCSECDASQEVYRLERLDDEPVVHYGTIASGDVVVKDASMRLQIQEKYSAICLEMEAAGLMNDFPCVVIRGISDYADSHKNGRWKPFAAAMAAAYAKELLEHVQPKAVDGEPALKDILCQVRDEVKNITKFNSVQQNQHILDWLTPNDFSKKQNDLFSQTQEGTGAWFLQSDEFKAWLSSPQGTLFCPGIPGAGKSLMSSIVVENLKHELQDPDVQVGCIFCDYQPAHQQTNIQLLLSLLKQLTVKDSQVLPNIAQLYTNHTKRNTHPTLQEIQSQLATSARSYRKVYLVVDALDEFLAQAPEEMQDFVTGILRLQMEAPVNILVTCRFNSAIMARFDGCQRKEIRAHEDDVLRYVNRRLPHLLFGQISKYATIEDSVRREVVKSADGMFLLAMLNLNYLGGYTNPGALEDAVLNLPNGEGRLEIAYQKGMEIIRAQQSPSYKLAVKTLSWLAYGKRALFATELQHALATHVGMKEFDPRYLTPLDIIDSVCAGLVACDRKSGVVRLVHYTTREFLVRDGTCGDAETEITRVSITYLSFGAFSQGRSLNESDHRRRQENYPLFHYCAKHWTAHANASLNFSEELLTFAMQFLDKDLHVSATAQAVMIQSIPTDGLTSNWMRNLPHQLTKVHLAALGGLTSVIEEYIRQNIDIDAPDSEGKTPLAYAATDGHLEGCRILLASNCVDPNHRDHFDGTPVLHAAYGRNAAVVKILIEHGANLKPPNEWKESALCVAASNGDIEIMRLLLDNGADINHRSELEGYLYGIPLLDAYSSGNVNAVIFLLDRGCDPNLQTPDKVSILSQACKAGNEQVVTLLLEKGADNHSNSNSDLFKKALEEATWGGFGGIVKQLLEAGVDPNSKGYRGETPLIRTCHHCSQEGNYEEVVRQLLEHGADPNIQSEDASTALLASAFNGCTGIVKMLLEYGASPEITNKHGETALSEASRHGHEDSVKALLQGRADPNTRNKSFENALFSAAKGGHTSICELLLDLGLSVNCQNIVGDSPLFLAAAARSESTVQLLIARGADIQHRNLMQETVLFFATTSAIARLLIAAGAIPDPVNLISETPLTRVVGSHSDISQRSCTPDGISLISLLLENGAASNPVRCQEYTSEEHRKAWDVLYSLIEKHPHCIRYRKSDRQLPYCEAARQIWGSHVESYNDEQILLVICKTTCHGVSFNQNNFRLAWKTGKASPLLRIVRWGHVDLLSKALSGMSTDTQSLSVDALFQEAVASQNPQSISLLLDRFTDSSIERPYLPTLLYGAAEPGDVPMMELLFAKQSFDSHCASLALVKAFQRGHPKAADFLLQKGAEVRTAQDSCISVSLLHVAISQGGTAMVKILQKRQIDVDIKNGFGQTPLFDAIAAGDQALVKLLLKQNIEVDARDKFGRTPLFYAAQYRQSSIAQILLQRDANPNITAFDGQKDSKALYQELNLSASRGHHWEIGTLTPLFVAVGSGQGDLVKGLLEKGADPNYRDNHGKTAIYLAAGEGFEVIVKMLLDAGSSVNHPEDSNKSPLMWAVQQKASGFRHQIFPTRGPYRSYAISAGDMDAVVRLLIQHGADANPIDENGQTPLQILSERCKVSRSLASTLLEAGGDPNQRSKFGRTPLMNAIAYGLDGMAAAFIEAPSVDKDARDIFGRTALIEATRSQNQPILKLLTRGCEVKQPLVISAKHPDQEEDEEAEEENETIRCEICRFSDQDGNSCSLVGFKGEVLSVCEECTKWGGESLEDPYEYSSLSSEASSEVCG